MGLDMWLIAEGNVNVDTGEKAQDIEIGSWRKANAIHRMILNEADGNIDTNCEKLYLNLDQLQRCLKKCQEVNSLLNNSKKFASNEDEYTFEPEVINEVMHILPPMPGFFFGSLDIDNYYQEDVKRSIEFFIQAINYYQLGHDIFYYCWW